MVVDAEHPVAVGPHGFKESVAIQRDWGTLLVCDRIRNPHNTSAVLRSAEAFGLARALVVDDRNPNDPGYKLCRGVAVGAQKWLPVEFMATPAEAIARAAAEGFELVVADSRCEGVPVADLPHAGRVAIVLGSELEGVHEEFLAAAECRVRIETKGFTESLNVSCAAAVVLHALTSGRRPVEPIPEETRDLLRRDWLRRTVRRHERILAEVVEREGE